MKILLLYAKHPYEVYNRRSALGSYIHCLSGLLESIGHEIFINGERFESDKYMNHVTTVHQKNKIKKIVPSQIKSIISDKKILKSYENLTKRINSDFHYDIILEFYSYFSEIGYKLKGQHQVPLITILDAPVLDEYEYFHKRKIFNRNKLVACQNKSLRSSDQIIVYNQPMKDYVGRITGKPEAIFIHQNIDFTRFEHSSPNWDTPELNIVFIGSFLKWHRVDLLVYAYKSLLEDFDYLNLYLIGDGMELSNIRKLISSLNLNNKIVVTGFKDGNELKELKKKMHIGVMPGSNWYGAPNKIFEYGASGMTVLAPDTPAIKDIFTEEEVLQFKQGDRDDLINKLYLICSDKNFRIKLAQHLQSKITSGYSSEKTIAFYSKRINFLK